MHHIAVRNHVLLPFYTKLSSFADFGLAAISKVVIVFDHFGSNETFFETCQAVRKRNDLALLERKIENQDVGEHLNSGK